jgi:hypothetical protein
VTWSRDGRLEGLEAMVSSCDGSGSSGSLGLVLGMDVCMDPMAVGFGGLLRGMVGRGRCAVGGR